MNFKLISPYRPTGDQPEAIRQLVEGINMGVPYQTLLGVTGSGKTFSVANVIEQVKNAQEAKKLPESTEASENA